MSQKTSEFEPTIYCFTEDFGVLCVGRVMTGRDTVIVRHLSEDDLDRLLTQTDSEKVSKRLTFVTRLSKGATLADAADDVGMSQSTGSQWTTLWNNGGLGLLAPSFGGGSLSRLGYCLSKIDVCVLPSTLSDESFEFLLCDVSHAGDSCDRFVITRSDESAKILRSTLPRRLPIRLRRAVGSRGETRLRLPEKSCCVSVVVYNFVHCVASSAATVSLPD